MSNVNLVSIFTLVLISLAILTGFTFVLDDVSQKNTRLTEDSINIMNNYITDVNANLDSSNLSSSVSLLNSSSGGSSEDFSREFRESKAAVISEKSRMDKILNIPQVVVNSIGLESDDQLLFYLTLIGIFLSFIIGLAIYIGIRTGKVQ
jgi:hypothetical protein